MLIRVNKKITSTKPKYAALSAALSAATSSGVWYDEASEALRNTKRKNAIRVKRDMSAKDNRPKYDA